MTISNDDLVGQQKPNGGAVPLIEMVIRFDPQTCTVSLVKAPVGDRFLCYGMLEMARDIIYRQHIPAELQALEQAQQQRGIVVVDGSLPLPPFRKS
jgi:hypothetical protein